MSSALESPEFVVVVVFFGLAVVLLFCYVFGCGILLSRDIFVSVSL